MATLPPNLDQQRPTDAEIIEKVSSWNIHFGSLEHYRINFVTEHSSDTEKLDLMEKFEVFQIIIA